MTFNYLKQCFEYEKSYYCDSIQLIDHFWTINYKFNDIPSGDEISKTQLYRFDRSIQLETLD